MAGLGLNIIISRMAAAEGPYAERLARLKKDVWDTLADLEEMVRTEALAQGVPERDLEEHAGVSVGMAVRRATESVLEETRKARAASRPQWHGGRTDPHNTP